MYRRDSRAMERSGMMFLKRHKVWSLGKLFSVARLPMRLLERKSFCSCGQHSPSSDDTLLKLRLSSTRLTND